MAIPESVTELLQPVVATLSVELVDVEWNGNTLRLVIDVEGGVTTEQLAKVNRLVSPILDQHDPIPGRYTLEVSSPGVERNLSRLDHYERAVGEDVVLKMAPGFDPRRVRGRLTAVRDDVLVVDVWEVDGNKLKANEVLELDRGEVAKGRTVFDWGPSPKPKGPPKKQKSGTNAESGKRAEPRPKNRETS